MESEEESQANPEKVIASLRKKLAAYSLISLLLGSTSVFGVFTYFVERPLKAENEELSSKLKYAELDKKEQEMVVQNYKGRITALERQIELSEGILSKQELDSLRRKLISTHAQLESDLRQLSNNLNQLRNRGGNWFRNNASKVAQQSAGIANRALDYNRRLKEEAENLARK